ncbi:hypothetical protein PILCRDRAFT_814412, partial [Piloderma croceum F 1598]
MDSRNHYIVLKGYAEAFSENLSFACQFTACPMIIRASAFFTLSFNTGRRLTTPSDRQGVCIQIGYLYTRQTQLIHLISALRFSKQY